MKYHKIFMMNQPLRIIDHQFLFDGLDKLSDIIINSLELNI